MAFDPPWRLDPLKRIVEVGWGGADVLVVRVDATINTHPPHDTSLEHLQFKDGIVDAWTTISEHDDEVPVPAIVDPISGEMLAHEFMWSRPVWKLHTSDGDHWRAVILLNLRRIKATLPDGSTDYEFEAHFPGSQDITTTSILYWIWSDSFTTDFAYAKAHPYTSGAVIDAEGHTGIVTVPFIWAPNSVAARDLFLGWNAGSLPPWLSYDEPVTDRVSDNFTWTLVASTYRKKLTFPVDSQNRPLWDENAAVSKKQDHGSAIIGGSPPITVKVKVNFTTLEVTLTRA